MQHLKKLIQNVRPASNYRHPFHNENCANAATAKQGPQSGPRRNTSKENRYNPGGVSLNLLPPGFRTLLGRSGANRFLGAEQKLALTGSKAHLSPWFASSGVDETMELGASRPNKAGLCRSEIEECVTSIIRPYLL